jgi:hypothetical protein
MKTTTMKFFAIGLLLAFGFIACKKESVSVNKSNTQLLTQKAWKIETHGLDENNNGVIEAAEADTLSCEVDDVYTFNSNGTGVYDGGTLSCSPGDPSIINFNWLFSNNETELAVFAAPEKINKLDENTLETYYEDVNSKGETVKYIRRFMH